LGELLSPKREYPSLRTQNFSPGFIGTRLGEPFSPERDCVSLNLNLDCLSELLEPKPWMNSCNSRLGEKESLGRKL